MSLKKPRGAGLRRLILTCAAASLLLAGCSPVGLAVGAGATAATAANQERGFGQAVDDNRIAIAIQAKLFGAGNGMLRKVDVEVHEKRVLLAGRVEKPAMRVDAVRLAWEVGGVSEVIDRIEIAEPQGFGGYMHDVWLAQKLRAVLLVDAHIRSINYNVDCVAGTIYLMGVAQDQAELQRVIDHARDIPHVRGVMNFVRLKNDPTRNGSPPAAQPAAIP
jgi:osmotically-inducible protein OsmY